MPFYFNAIWFSDVSEWANEQANGMNECEKIE